MSPLGSRVTIKIPRDLYDALKKLTSSSGFSSVNEFIVYVMRTVASGGEPNSNDRLTGDEITAVRERLLRLGYLTRDE